MYIGAMVILLFAAVLLSLTDREDSVHHQHSSGNASFETGFLPVIAASALSGFGAAMTQRSMQVHQRDAALVTMELSMYGSIFLVLSAITTQRDTMGEFVSLSNGTALYEFVAGWDSFTFIPVISNALGGILVGNVTKYVGGVMKSFALIVGIAFTAFLEAYLYNESISIHVWIAAVLVIISMSMYNKYPYEEKKKTE
jgi:UDP-sugar transporter A1/2/3